MTWKGQEGNSAEC